LIFFAIRCKIDNQMILDIYEKNNDHIDEAAKALKNGGLVAMPTETVYGLAANAMDAAAVAGIFALKGRPADNPLIVHVDSLPMARDLAEFSEKAEKLADVFWPGPLTLVLKSRGVVPGAVTAGLDTVGLRMPDCDAALALVSAAGVPLAAPSANMSGSPSPTTAAHVAADFGEQLMILDAGECGIGVESTVVDMTREVPVILRPGAVTQDMLAACIGAVDYVQAFLPFEEDRPAAPGMKYRHYAPTAKMTVVEGEAAAVTEAVKYLYDKELKKGEKPLVMAAREHKRHYGKRDVAVTGSADEPGEAAKNLYGLLRGADADGFTSILFEAVPKTGIGFAVMNRVYKAAAYNIVRV
jgi:L-threonylcarbamoyladenylate synthase